MPIFTQLSDFNQIKKYEKADIRDPGFDDYYF